MAAENYERNSWGNLNLKMITDLKNGCFQQIAQSLQAAIIHRIKGLSRIQLPGGEMVLLKHLLESFPNETLGERHVDKFGPNLGVLLKIFDVGDNSHIPIHWHPAPEFAQEHLNSPFGKTEAWIIIGTRPGAKAWIGCKETLSRAEFAELMHAQDIESLRSLMHLLEPQVGRGHLRSTRRHPFARQRLVCY